MHLWTIQSCEAYEQLTNQGILHADSEKVTPSLDNYFRRGYAWMADKMIEYGLYPPQGITYPLWAWYMFDGKREIDNPRKHLIDYQSKGIKSVLLKIDVPVESVLLSDFDMFHIVLNQGFVASNDPEEIFFWYLVGKTGCTFQDIFSDCLSPEALALRNLATTSWEKAICDFIPGQLELYRKYNYVQATFWELHKGQIIAVID